MEKAKPEDISGVPKAGKQRVFSTQKKTSLQWQEGTMDPQAP